MRIDVVVKLGGSLLAGRGLRRRLAHLETLARRHRVVVVPGGGPLADAVRALDRRIAPGDSASHWMAVLTMDQHAHLLAGLLPSAVLVRSAAAAARAAGGGRLALLAPYAWLRRTDPLPHGWHVTSDSIAAWIAARLRARRLVLWKAVDGVPGRGGAIQGEIGARAAAARGVVDECFPRALGPGLECWILNGRRPERLRDLLRSGRTRGTRVRRDRASRGARGPGRR